MRSFDVFKRLSFMIWNLKNSFSYQIKILLFSVDFNVWLNLDSKAIRHVMQTFPNQVLTNEQGWQNTQTEQEHEKFLILRTGTEREQKTLDSRTLFLVSEKIIFLRLDFKLIFASIECKGIHWEPYPQNAARRLSLYHIIYMIYTV